MNIRCLTAAAWLAFALPGTVWADAAFVSGDRAVAEGVYMKESALLDALEDLENFVNYPEDTEYKGKTLEQTRAVVYELILHNERGCVNDVCFWEGWAFTPLRTAVRMNDAVVVRLLLEKGANPAKEVNWRGFDGSVDELPTGPADELPKNADPKAREEIKQLLNRAWRNTLIDALYDLEYLAGNPGVSEDFRQRRLYIPGNTLEKARKLVVEFIEKNEDDCVNDICSREGYKSAITPLHLAVRMNDADLVKRLLARGVNPAGGQYRDLVEEKPGRKPCTPAIRKLLDGARKKGASTFNKEQ